MAKCFRCLLFTAPCWLSSRYTFDSFFTDIFSPRKLTMSFLNMSRIHFTIFLINLKFFFRILRDILFSKTILSEKLNYSPTDFCYDFVSLGSHQTCPPVVSFFKFSPLKFPIKFSVNFLMEFFSNWIFRHYIFEK